MRADHGSVSLKTVDKNSDNTEEHVLENQPKAVPKRRAQEQPWVAGNCEEPESKQRYSSPIPGIAATGGAEMWMNLAVGGAPTDHCLVVLENALL